MLCAGFDETVDVPDFDPGDNGEDGEDKEDEDEPVLDNEDFDFEDIARELGSLDGTLHDDSAKMWPGDDADIADDELGPEDGEEVLGDGEELEYEW